MLSRSRLTAHICHPLLLLNLLQHKCRLHHPPSTTSCTALPPLHQHQHGPAGGMQVEAPHAQALPRTCHISVPRTFHSHSSRRTHPSGNSLWSCQAWGRPPEHARLNATCSQHEPPNQLPHRRCGLRRDHTGSNPRQVWPCMFERSR
jgi:hypothetical protein